MFRIFGLIAIIIIALLVLIIDKIKSWYYVHELKEESKRKDKEIQERKALEKIIKENEEVEDE